MAIGKRDRTRNKLLTAAQQLALEGGAAALTVYNLTERAEVALGTFYNYYRTREDVLDDICELLVAASREDIVTLTQGMSDPAAIVAASVRQTLRSVVPGSDIGRLLFEASLPMQRFVIGMRRFFIQDLEAGKNSGVFRVDKEAAVITMVSGSSFGSMQDIYRQALPLTMIEDITEMTLRLLGVEPVLAAEQSRAAIAFHPPRQLPLSALELLPPLGAASK